VPLKEGTPSATAEAMAGARAFGSSVYRREKILDDPLAEHFLAGRHRLIHRLVRLGVRPLNLAVASLYDWMLPGGIGYVLTRHRYFDDVVEEAVEGGARQLVLVGAGYDSRAFRQKALSKARVFEVDHPDTQARKKEIVRRLFGELPPNVDYVALNATQGDLRRLPDLGFDRRVRAVFVLEGFIWYMPPDVARAILRALVEISTPGSQVVFDYILPSVVDGSCVLEGAQAHRKYCARRGEPILSGIEPDQLGTYLRENGLSLLEDVGHEHLKARYTADSRRRIRIYPFLRIARASVGVH
jgi:methyltransferase (TIGR00027 family)